MEPPDPPAAVSAALARLPDPLLPRLMDLRRLIFEVAAGDPRIGPLTETLKWGEPAYLTRTTGAGSTIRLGHLKGEPEICALFFICTTRLVDGFRARFPDLDCRGDRAVALDVDSPIPPEIAACIAEALTYHADKRQRGSA